MSQPVTEFFENIEITINAINIERVDELYPAGDQTNPTSSIYQQMSLIEIPGFKELVGTVKIIFRDVSTKFKQTIFTEGQFSVKIPVRQEVADSFYSLVKFIFDYTNHQVAEKQITDDSGMLFKVPQCAYTKKDFENVIIE